MKHSENMTKSIKINVLNFKTSAINFQKYEDIISKYILVASASLIVKKEKKIRILKTIINGI